MFKLDESTIDYGAWSAAVSCSDDNNEPDSPVPPTADVDVTEVQRASVSFTIKSSDATDFAYIIAEQGADAPASAEVIFETGTTGILENGSVAVVSNEVEGGKSYVVYAAVRKINPYVYSEISITDFNTDIPYTSMITLNRVGINDLHSISRNLKALKSSKNLSCARMTTRP